jgi:hypothetical protein
MQICKKYKIEYLYRTKLKVIVLIVILIGIFLLIYQMKSLEFPGDEFLDYSGHGKVVQKEKHIHLKGIRPSDIPIYIPNEQGNFMCFHTREEIAFSRVNDDFCDCLFDGSDEPGTSACPNGRFYCDTQKNGFPGTLGITHINVQTVTCVL